MTTEPDLLRGSITSTDGTSVLTLVGEVDLATAGALDRLLSQAEATGSATNIVVDVSRLEFLGVVGVNVLLAHRARLARRGRTLSLQSPSALAQRLLDAVALREVFIPETCVPAARHSVTG